MKPRKVVVRFINGITLKGQTNDFSPNKKTFHLVTLNGEVEKINTHHLKAVFFVKKYKGDKYRMDHYNDLISSGGKIIKVTFYDGERITGFSDDYSSETRGFYLIPTDNKSNSERIYIFSAATAKIELRDAVFSGQHFSERNILRG